MSLSSKRRLYNGTLKHFNYHVDNFVLPSVDCVNDLNVSHDLNFSFRPRINNIINIVAKASLRAKLILKCFRSAVHLRPFCTFVRPVLEFSSVIWSPYYRIDIDTVEKGHRFTRAVFSCKRLTYEERLAVRLVLTGSRFFTCVCMFIRTISQKPMQLGSTNLT